MNRKAGLLTTEVTRMRRLVFKSIPVLFRTACLEENLSAVYNDLIDLIRKIAEYVLKKSEKLQERMDAVMGGKILELASERIRREVAEEYEEKVKESELQTDAANLRAEKAEKQVDALQETIRQLREQLATGTPAVQ